MCVNNVNKGRDCEHINNNWHRCATWKNGPPKDCPNAVVKPLKLVNTCHSCYCKRHWQERKKREIAEDLRPDPDAQTEPNQGAQKKIKTEKQRIAVRDKARRYRARKKAALDQSSKSQIPSDGSQANDTLNSGTLHDDAWIDYHSTGNTISSENPSENSLVEESWVDEKLPDSSEVSDPDQIVDFFKRIRPSVEHDEESGSTEGPSPLLGNPFMGYMGNAAEENVFTNQPFTFDHDESKYIFDLEQALTRSGNTPERDRSPYCNDDYKAFMAELHAMSGGLSTARSPGHTDSTISDPDQK